MEELRNKWRRLLQQKTLFLEETLGPRLSTPFYAHLLNDIDTSFASQSQEISMWRVISKIIGEKDLKLSTQKIAKFCPQGSGTLRQHLTILPILHYLAWFYTNLQYLALSCTILHYFAPSCTMLHHVASCYTKLNHAAPCCTMLNHVKPCCTILHHLAPSCTILHHLAS